MLDRREFLAGSMAAAVAMKADAAPRTAKGEWRNRQAGMAYRQLGRTGFMISEVVMGGNTISPNNYEHVLAAMDRGLNYLDTAPAYGNTESEKGYAKILKARKRDQFFLNSKVSVWDANRSKLFQDIFARQRRSGCGRRLSTRLRGGKRMSRTTSSVTLGASGRSWNRRIWPT
jgi:hypothetical protein